MHVLAALTFVHICLGLGIPFTEFPFLLNACFAQKGKRQLSFGNCWGPSCLSEGIASVPIYSLLGNSTHPKHLSPQQPGKMISFPMSLNVADNGDVCF